MTQEIGIQVVAPKTSIYNPTKTYESQMLSSRNALIEKDRGESDSIDVPHSTKDVLPLSLQSKINGNKRGALTLTDINETHLVINENVFYRIFENTNEPAILIELFEDDMIGEFKIIPFLSLPTGWLECNGSAISRTTYSELFALIGTTFGVGDGSTTFNLPDFRGRVLIHKSADTEFDTLGETGGAKTHTLSTGEMPSHTHTQNSHNHTQDAHSHNTYSNFNVAGGGATVTGAPGDSRGNPTENTTATNQAATATNQNTGGGGAHNNLQPYIVAGIWIIKAL